MKRLLILLTLPLLALSACSSEEPVKEQEVTDLKPSLETIKSDEIIVEAGEFFFDPTDLTLTAGEEVTITLKNVGKGQHDLRIEELNLGTSIIGPGETESFTFTVPGDQDSLTIFCSVNGHRELGMEESITIN